MKGLVFTKPESRPKTKYSPKTVYCKKLIADIVGEAVECGNQRATAIKHDLPVKTVQGWVRRNRKES